MPLRADERTSMDSKAKDQRHSPSAAPLQTEGVPSPRVVLVTGYSGAGRSVALAAFEDIGFRVIDHLPLTLLKKAVEYFIESYPKGDFAIGVDIRFLNAATAEFSSALQELKPIISTEVLFITCDSETIVRRYASTRRRHPLSSQGVDLETMVLREIAILEGVRDQSDHIFDTTLQSPHQLARQIELQFGSTTSQRKLFVSISSFGFKYGTPRDIDMIYDVRFLQNPYFVESLKEKNGLDSEVSNFVLEDPRSQTFLTLMVDTLKFAIPEYYKEGKHYFRIGIGCTGGQHRSVTLAEALSKKLFELDNKQVCFSVFHRDL